MKSKADISNAQSELIRVANEYSEVIDGFRADYYVRTLAWVMDDTGKVPAPWKKRGSK
jgi:hypothetical protein